MTTQGFQMTYLKDFQSQISNHDYPGLVRLWEEYCLSDEIDERELESILKIIKNSDFVESFGKQVEKILPLWEKLQDTSEKAVIFKLIIDLETTNHEQLRQYILDYLKNKYGSDENFDEKIRLIGLKTKENFQGAVSHFELVHNMKRGKFVFHKGGWGTGEIIDVSKIREQLSIEFEHVLGKKDMSFSNAFNMLVPLSDDNFFAQRFGNPDQLEEKAKSDPLQVIHLLLRDLGPKTAAEIKEELCELVIPEKDWAKWWQTARTKMKKDTMINLPEDLKQPFALRNSQITHEEQFHKLIETKTDINDFIQLLYSFIRDFSETLKNQDFKKFIQLKIQENLSYPHLTDAQILQLHCLLEDLSLEKNGQFASTIIKDFSSIPSLIQSVDILAFKKRILIVVRKIRPDWKELFLDLVLTIDQNSLRDYLFQELSSSDPHQLKEKIDYLVKHPVQYPQACIWYFQKLIQNKESLGTDIENKNRFFEAFLIVLNHIEQDPQHRDLMKKMHHILTNNRYVVVRDIMKEATLEDIQEFLLLASKCYSLSDHDLKIFHSLAEVIYPSLAKMRKKQDVVSEETVIWTTETGYQKVKERIQKIATVEAVQNAKDIEAARSHGDLRENMEFKAALERKNQLQSELKNLSDQLKVARVLTKADVTTNEVSIGCIVECRNQNGKNIFYTLLGPWDTDVEKGIVSFQSKLAKDIMKLKVGDHFQFQGEDFTITAIKNYFES